MLCARDFHIFTFIAAHLPSIAFGLRVNACCLRSSPVLFCQRRAKKERLAAMMGTPSSPPTMSVSGRPLPGKDAGARAGSSGGSPNGAKKKGAVSAGLAFFEGGAKPVKKGAAAGAAAGAAGAAARGRSGGGRGTAGGGVGGGAVGAVAAAASGDGVSSSSDRARRNKKDGSSSAAAAGQPSSEDASAGADTGGDIVANEKLAAELVSCVGLSIHGARRAAIMVRNRNVALAADWAVANMGKPGFNDPIAAGQTLAAANAAARAMRGDGGSGRDGALKPSEPIVAALVSMGFNENGSRRAAVAVRNANVDEAVGWAVAHMDDADFKKPMT